MNPLAKLLREFPAPTGATISAVAAAVLMIYNVYTGQAPFDAAVLTAAIAALYQWWTSRKVTPLARPRDADKTPLAPVSSDGP